jgi:tetratricopeptide (TPR) repeat protein
MKRPFLLSLAQTVVSTVFLGAVLTPVSLAQGQAVVSPTSPEFEAFNAVAAATNPTIKLAAAEDFINKFPASSARIKVAELVANDLYKVSNPAAAIVLVERANKIFTTDQEREVFKPVTLESYANANKFDEAFELAEEILQKNPDDIYTLIKMTSAGSREAKKRERQHVAVALDYGNRAIGLIESDKRTAGTSDEKWSELKAAIGQLYQDTAILCLANGNIEEAKTRLMKATALQPNEPSNYALLGRVINADYVQQMTTYESMPESRAKEETKKRMEGLVDMMIDAYARSAALSAGRPEYEKLLQQVIPDLTSYYKYRYQSTKGLQQLINKYRVK